MKHLTVALLLLLIFHQVISLISLPTSSPTPTPSPTLTPSPTRTPAPTRAMTSTPADACFNGKRVHIADHMNIRASHTTNSAIVGTAKRGDVFGVSASKQGRLYCWLKIAGGWMAETPVVHSKMPIELLPQIEGDDEFVKDIHKGFKFLWDKAPVWYWYVTEHIPKIKPSPFFTTSLAQPRGRVLIGESFRRDMLRLASNLVHEACHMAQFARGIMVSSSNKMGKIEVEKECVGVQYDMVKSVSRFGEHANRLRAILSWSTEEWLASSWFE